MNQLATKDQVKNLIAIRKSIKRGKAGNLAENPAFLDFIAIQRQVNEEINKTWEVIEDRMTEFDIKSIKGDWGHITFAERQNFKLSGRVTPSFTKRVLDNEKVRGYFNLYKKLPAGISLSTTKYLSKKIKAV
jgi:hypothetical protein